LYGYETWSLILRKKGRLRVSENRVLKIMFCPKRDEVTEEWGKLHTLSVLLTKYYSGDHIENNGMGGAWRTRGKRGGAYRILVGKPDEKRQLGTPSPR
jgi:hypothetical protein